VGRRGPLPLSPSSTGGRDPPCACFVGDLPFFEPRRFGLSVSETYHRASLPTKTRYFPRLLWRHICRQNQLGEADAIVYVTSGPKDAGEYVMDTNTLLIILVVIFLFGGFGFYGRGRWF
jgi:hypothetical protein